jgi:hypothetical protein
MPGEASQDGKKTLMKSDLDFSAGYNKIVSLSTKVRLTKTKTVWRE